MSDALARLERMAGSGCLPEDVAREAEAIAAGWWRNAQGDLAPDRLVLPVQKLQRWCAVAAGRHMLRWDHLNRAGQPRDAEDATQWAQALDQAQRALRVYT